MPKKISWPAIKKRYLAGEKPVDIAKDYGITSKQIRDKASREGWSTLKSTIHDEIATEVRQQAKAEILDTKTLMGTIYGRMLQRLNDNNEGLRPTRERGQDIPEAYHFETYKQGLKHFLELERQANQNPSNDGPRIIGLPGVDPDAL